MSDSNSPPAHNDSNIWQAVEDFVPCTQLERKTTELQAPHYHGTSQANCNCLEVVAACISSKLLAFVVETVDVSAIAMSLREAPVVEQGVRAINR